jgi:hypothetical protein
MSEKTEEQTRLENDRAELAFSWGSIELALISFETVVDPPDDFPVEKLPELIAQWKKVKLATEAYNEFKKLKAKFGTEVKVA